MASRLVLLLDRLKATVATQNTASASQIIDGLNQYFDDRISDAEIGKQKKKTKNFTTKEMTHC